MNIVPTNITVSDFCEDLVNKKMVVNHNYQRSDQVWPSIAQSFFIETILLAFPVPKLSLHQVANLKTRKTHKEIVDGQQRSTALLDFYRGDLRLSTTLETKEIAGKKYGQLDESFQKQFLNYSLSCDLFVGATEADIREVFRRINAYTVPLNPEEERHAIYQGEMKWFIHRLSRKLETTFLAIGVFNQKQIVRLADTKLLADMTYAFINGIHTTKRKQLDSLYKAHNEAFAAEKDIGERFRSVFKLLFAWTDLHGTAMVKPHMVYSLGLAISHLLKPCATLKPLFDLKGPKAIDPAVALPNLTRLSSILSKEEDDVPPEFRSFYLSSTRKTNVAEYRADRFTWMCRALTEELD